MIGLPPRPLKMCKHRPEKVRAEVKKASGKKPMIRVSVSTFVPKPHTPFQWAARLDEQALNPRLEILRRGLNLKGVKFSWHDPRIGLLEAALSRGDRRTGKAIYRAWELGCKFDAWTEQYNHENGSRPLPMPGDPLSLSVSVQLMKCCRGLTSTPE
jgi:radical SAM superfamily enzyme YgiQ (UPF0313 family)